ncbi:hypothetical protein EES45_00215 [Streptomyces sp. ADI97-07]|nr:hypothetical protein EES45_00215 [Streptomyces sp. ADI97-07]
MGTRRRWRRTTFRTGTTAVVAARVPALDCTRWRNSLSRAPTCCCPYTIRSSPVGISAAAVRTAHSSEVCSTPLLADWAVGISKAG